MKAHYEELSTLLIDNGFCTNETVIAGNKMMCTKKDKTYICHIDEDNSGYFIDNCKYYKSRSEAILTIIKLIAELQDEM